MGLRGSSIVGVMFAIRSRRDACPDSPCGVRGVREPSGIVRSSASAAPAPTGRSPRRRARAPRRRVEHEAAHRGPDHEAELPGERRERHVAARAAADPRDRRRAAPGRRRAGTRRSRRSRPRPRAARRAAPVGQRRRAARASQRGRPEDAEQRERAHSPAPFGEPGDRQLREHDHERVHEEDERRSRLADARLVLRETGSSRAGHAGEDEQRVERDHAHEHAVSQHVAVAARRPRRAALARRLAGRQRSEHAEVHEEGRARRGGRGAVNVPGSSVVAISPPASAAEADAEVHHHPLHRERRVPAVGRRQAGDERRLRGPEAADADPGERAATKRCHGSCTSGNSAEADRQEDERAAEHAPSAEAVDERADHRARDELTARSSPAISPAVPREIPRTLCR